MITAQAKGVGLGEVWARSLIWEIQVFGWAARPIAPGFLRAGLNQVDRCHASQDSGPSTAVCVCGSRGKEKKGFEPISLSQKHSCSHLTFRMFTARPVKVDPCPARLVAGDFRREPVGSLIRICPSMRGASPPEQEPPEDLRCMRCLQSAPDVVTCSECLSVRLCEGMIRRENSQKRLSITVSPADTCVPPRQVANACTRRRNAWSSGSCGVVSWCGC
jgi:hypothetical protein